MPQLTQDQINKLKSLGIEIDQNNQNIKPPFLREESPDLSGQVGLNSDIAKALVVTQTSPFFKGRCPEVSEGQRGLKHNNVFPLLSLSGLTLLSLSGLILFKSKGQTASNTVNNTNTTLPETSVSPTQVPKSIQHYLLTSQQFFTQASQNQSIDDLNQSILAATDAIKEFPNDYRGYYQRGRIYQSVLSSKPELASQIIADLSQAQKLEPNNAEITRSLASVYAQNGDAQNTINYLSQTIALEPTKAQNFYDLAKIQQQVGLFPQAIETYDKLISLVSDPVQKNQVELEKSSLEQLVSQNPNHNLTQPNQNISIPPVDLPSSLDSPTIQANTGLPALVAELPAGLIVAAPEELNQIEVSNLTASNSLSGTNILISGQKEITIPNTQITSTSQVYVTILKGGKNQNLQVLSKSPGSFVVGLDSSINENIEFKWWIIN